jgi:ribonuclease D
MSAIKVENRPIITFQEDISSEYVHKAQRSQLLAWDIETSGLDWRLDKIGVCQLCIPDGPIAVVKLADAPPQNLCRVLTDRRIQKIFHHAMFDLRFMVYNWRVSPQNMACTKIAAKLLRFENGNGSSLQMLLKRFLGISIDKSLQTSDWVSGCLTNAQISYAFHEVAHLMPLLQALERELQAVGRLDLAHACFAHIPARVRLEIGDFGDVYGY